MVTPIDWKLYVIAAGDMHAPGRQSLVTPIDWKPSKAGLVNSGVMESSPILGDAY